MKINNIQLFLYQFQRHTQAKKHYPVCLLCDNHESHISVERFDYASESGVFMLTFTPHKLQSLGCTVYGQFYKSCESWMYYNPGKTMTIYETQEMIGCSYPNSVTQANIQSGLYIYILLMRVSLHMYFFESRIRHQRWR